MKKSGKTNKDSYITGIWRRHFFPVLTWMAVLACVIMLFVRRTQRFEVIGLVQGFQGEVASTTIGNLKTMNVKLFDIVAQGDILCTLNDDRITSQLQTAASTIKRLQAEVAAAQARLQSEQINLQNDWVADNRRFALNVEQTQLRRLEISIELETDKLTLADLALDVNIARQLLQRQAIAEYDLRKKELAYNILQKKIEENQSLLAQATEIWKNAQERQRKFAECKPAHISLDTALKPLQLAVAEQNNVIKELELARASLVLKAPFAGVVKEIIRQSGDTVMPGEPIMMIEKAEQPQNIIAYVKDEQANQIHKGQQVVLVTRTHPSLTESSSIQYVGPDVIQIPQRLWLNPTIPEYGRPFLLGIPQKWDKLVPGQSVGIHQVTSRL